MSNSTVSLPAHLLTLLAEYPQLKIVSVIIRNGPSGWHAIDTSGHQAIGVSAVSEDSGGVYVHFTFTANKVVGFTQSVDEYFATQQMMVGASVGYAQAYLQFGKVGASGAVNPSTLSADGNAQFIGLFI